MATPDHSAAPIASKITNFHIGNRTTPAIDVATEAKPGMNLATASERAPQRAKMDAVCRTQESGDSETRHMVFGTPLPNLRPAVYHATSAISAANTATASNAGTEDPPRVARAPVMISVEYAGTGNPACSSSTFTNTNASP